MTNCPTCGQRVEVGGKEGSTRYYVPVSENENDVLKEKLWEAEQKLEVIKYDLLEKDKKIAEPEKHELLDMKELQKVIADRDKWKERAEKAADAAEMLWVLVLNVSSGDWQSQSEEWRERVDKWKETYFKEVLEELRKESETEIRKRV